MSIDQSAERMENLRLSDAHYQHRNPQHVTITTDMPQTSKPAAVLSRHLIFRAKLAAARRHLEKSCLVLE
jgi:hypothetical protein